MLALVAIAVAPVRVQRLRRQSGSCCPNPSGTARWTQSDREYNELIGTRKRCMLKEQAVGMQTAAVGRHGTCMSLARYRFHQVSSYCMLRSMTPGDAVGRAAARR